MDKRCQIFYKKCISNLFVLITLRIKMQHMNKEILIYNIFASLKGMCVYKKKEVMKRVNCDRLKLILVGVYGSKRHMHYTVYMFYLFV